MKTNNGKSGMMKNGFVALACLGLGLGVTVTGCDDDDGDDDIGDAATGGFGAGGGGLGGSGGGSGGSPPGDASADGRVDADTTKPRGATQPANLGLQLDRMGRPAIATALIGTFDGIEASKKATKDTYNMAPMPAWGTYAGEVKKNLAILDALDGNCGNQFAANQSGARYSFLAGVLADDRLYVNAVSGSCGVYLGVEASLVLGVNAPANVSGSCGGRTPNDDVIERSYSVLAAGVLNGVDDMIQKDSDATLDLSTFPWLAAPIN